MPTPFEVAAGWVHGRLPVPSPAGPWPRESPEQAFRAVLREELVGGPCVVPFSGGRDSSLVLAIACSVAREAGVDRPMAVTFRHPGMPESDETAWQELVMDHLHGLGLEPEWRIREITDELDVVGPLVAPLLEETRHSLWPPNSATVIALAREAPRAAILSGEFGDEVLGVRRCTVVAGLLRRRGHVPPVHWRAAAGAAAPRVLAAGAIRAHGTSPAWLNSRGRRRWRSLAAADVLQEPFRYDRNLRLTLRRRGPQLGMANLAAVCRRSDCRLVAPIAHPRVLAAMAADGGWRGPQSRGYATELLGGGSLPQRLYRRDTKADFRGSRFHRHTIATVDAWKGTEISREWVDGERLRSAWAARAFHPQMAGLVQDAWLAQQGLS